MRFRGDYYFLSNMYKCDVPMPDGNVYTCAEAAFQAQKCENAHDKEQFCGIDGYTARKLGRLVQLRPYWNDIRVSVMQDVIDGKFSDKTLADKLMRVEGLIVEDNTWGDTFWGQVNGQGENHLGKLLMKKRDELLLENKFVTMDLRNKNGDTMRVNVYGTDGNVEDDKTYRVTWDEQAGFAAGSSDLLGAKIRESMLSQKDTSSIKVDFSVEDGIDKEMN